MMRSIIFTAVALTLAAGPALAAPCKDPKTGKFIACPKKTSTKIIQKSSTTTTTTGGKCRDAKGHFAKCGTPGAKPA